MNRAQSLNSTNLDLFFEMCQKYYDHLEMHDKPHNIYNVDESGFSGDQGGLKILCKKGMKTPSKISSSNDKIMYTVAICCNAAGQFLPPYIVYKAKSIYDLWTQNGPERAEYTYSDSGWMETQQFLN